MAIANSYFNSSPITDSDIFVGTKYATNRTVNYTAQSIADYLNVNARISISGQLTFKFTILPNVAKTIAFENGGGDGRLFSSIDKLIVSILDAGGSNITVFLDYLIDSEILLAEQNQPNSFGHYKVTNYVVTTNPNFYELSLEYIGGNGNIYKDVYYDMTPWAGSGGIVTTPNLQQVTDEGNTTTNDITISKETGTSFIQLVSNNNTLTLQVNDVSGSYIELNDSDNNNYGALSCAELVMTNNDAGENVQLNSNYLLIQSSNSKPLIELSGSDFTLTGSVQIKTDLVDGQYEQQLPNKGGTFAMLDDIPALTAGTNITIDNTDPLNLIISASGGGDDFLSLAGGTMDDGANIFFNNGSKLSEGAVDAGTGGNKGIALTCAVGFEWKFEAGEAYLTETTSGYIRLKQYARNLPTIDDDISKGFVNGSFWYLDSGIAYICTDSTNGAAVWEIYHNFIPTLQQVVNEGGQLTDLGIAFDSVVNPNLTAGINIDGLAFIDNDGIDEETTVYASNGIQRNLNANGTLLNFETPTNPDNVVLVPNGSGTLALTSDIPTAGVTSVGLTMPSAFTVTNSPITSSGDIAVTGAGLVSQYVRGDGTLANFPNSTGGGSSVNYYLNGSISQGTFGGTTYYQMSKTPILGAGTNFIRTNGAGNGYIASFITDVADPSQLNIPGGNWNVEFYFNASSGGGSPSFYAELYTVSATNVFTLIASDSLNPESITNGTTVDQYFTSIPVPQTTLLTTDRLAIRIFVNTGGKTITLHTENGNLSEVLTTFTTGLTALNGLTTQVQNFAVGTSGTDFGISSATETHTFNLPTASAINRGALSSADWTTFNNKQNDLVTFQRKEGIIFFDDFLGTNDNAGISTSTGVTMGAVGTGSIARITGVYPNRTNQQGVIQLATGTLTTGGASYRLGSVNTPTFFVGTGAISYEVPINIETLSTLTNRFVNVFGFYTGSSITTSNNLISFIYDEGGVFAFGGIGASPNWKCVTGNGGTRTSTDSTVAVTASAWTKLRIEINANATSIGFYINDTLVATHTTNIPATTTAMYFLNGIQKTTGLTSVNMYADYLSLKQTFTTAR
jgi:hypothetical protein